MKKRWIVFLMFTLIVGCASNRITITKEDAVEIAMDAAAQLDTNDIKNSVKEKGDLFEVHLTVQAGEYTYLISKHGIIKSTKFKQNEIVEEESGKDETVDEQNKAAENALYDIGVSEIDVENMEVNTISDGYEIIINLKTGVTYVVTTNVAGDVISTIIQ